MADDGGRPELPAELRSQRGRFPDRVHGPLLNSGFADGSDREHRWPADAGGEHAALADPPRPGV